MKKVIVLTIVLALVMILASPVTAMAAGNGYGKAIQDCLGAPYGQAKNEAWASGHAEKPALGAKLTAIAHGCTVCD